MNRSTSMLFALLVSLSASIAFGQDRIDFNTEIRPLLSGKCFACHGPDENERAADLRLDTQAGSQMDLGGYFAIVPGDPAESELVRRMITDDVDERMPPDGKGEPLNNEEVSLVKRWIEQGAEYATHWSYTKPKRPAIPSVAHPKFPIRNPIDAFVLRRMLVNEMHPTERADRLTLARRVSLDLTGLPPSWNEAKKFADDPSTDALVEYVDRLLAQPGYGERWAQVWLDLARYADSAGHSNDLPRTIWAYRDWVIKAFNENKPFDQFTIEQIGGDLLDNPTDDQLVATAFHRNTLTNNEGGTSNEEFRNAAVVDRVNTTMEVWMGTTMACAQCHTHKYDPITQAEYFQLFDFFNQTEDNDLQNEKPVLDLWLDPAKLEQKTMLQTQISKLESTLKQDTEAIEQSRQNWITRMRTPAKWNRMVPQKMTGGNLVQRNDWIEASESASENATFRIQFAEPESPITAIRLETGPDQSSNFVLSQVKATWTPTPNEGAATGRTGRFVRLELPGNNRILHVAEIEIFSGSKNVAGQGTATQSSTDYQRPADVVIDGNSDGRFEKGSVNHTRRESNPWIEIDLGSETEIDQIVVWNRLDGQEARLSGYQLRVLSTDRKIVYSTSSKEVPRPSQKHLIDGRVDLNFIAAFADYEQPGFVAKSVIQKLNPKKGWAIGGEVNQPHELTLSLNKAFNPKGGTIEVILEQKSIHKNHLLKQFRVSFSSDRRAVDAAKIPANIRRLLAKEVRSQQDEQLIAEFYRTIAPELRTIRTEIEVAQGKLAKLKPTTTVPIMKERSQPRETRIQIRGNFQNTSEVVHRATPAAFHPLPDSAESNRLTLARWLVDPNNPLTARVIVNRFWEQIFGIGIVATNEEFGSQGELPTHPELLDWLATEFQKDWNVKRLLKLMVTSSTYCQSSKVTKEQLALDPQNRYLSRGPRFRIPAETIRDQALKVSGLLNPEMYGPPVKPYQPDLGLRAAFGSVTDWKMSSGGDRYRRGVYTSWRRSNPYASMVAFDAPNREVCTSRRGRTNTPLQALVTLNDPVYIEAAQALARQVVQHGGSTPEERIAFAFRECLTREPARVEIDELKKMLNSASKLFTAQPEQARTMAEHPLGPLPKELDEIELASWTVLSNVILNLDEIFLKR